jgi:hypothetical protein
MKKFNPLMTALVLTVAGASIAPAAALADTGWYIGGSFGTATLDVGLGDMGIPALPTSLDADDAAYKVFAGINLDLPVVDVGVEVNYVDFGEPQLDILGEPLLAATTGFNVAGIAGLDLGPMNVFGKVGYSSWDTDIIFEGNIESAEDDGLSYGIGLRFGLGPVQIRGEYEIFDLDDAEFDMLSVGIAFQF